MGIGVVKEAGNLAEALGAWSQVQDTQTGGGCWGISLLCDALGLTMNRGHLPSEEPFQMERSLRARSSHNPLSALGAKPWLELWVTGAIGVRHVDTVAFNPA